MPVVTPRFDLDPDPTLGGANASDEVGATQKAVKDYVDSHGGSTYTAGNGISIDANNEISVTSPTLTNTATGYLSLSILGNASTHSNAINIGVSSAANRDEATAVGYQTTANGDKSLALGFNASASGTSSIQLGSGVNHEDNSFYVSTANDTTKNWKMLGNDGLIPDARISSNIARTSAIPTVDQTYDGTSTNAQSGTAVAEAIAGFSGANTDLSNLTSTGQNIANWSSNVTNCITEIPQDIKLELNNGTLTLKAGSKVYVPNGEGVFDEIVVNTDKTVNVGSGSSTNLVFYSLVASAYGNISVSNIRSGTSVPSSFTGVFYNITTNNIDYYINSAAQGSSFSLPIAVITTSSGTVTSLDQVFNGFGYIGSTIFALPGVKGLIPDGRNDDGSLKNIEFTVSNVISRTFTTQTVNYGDWGINPSMNPIIGISSAISYDENSNIVIESGNNWNRCIFGKGILSSGVISNFSIKTVYHALDYNDSSTISGFSMPSSRYKNLTLGASGATYTAPANGWVMFRRTPTAVGQEMQIKNDGGSAYQFFIQSGKASGIVGACMPVKKNDTFTVSYSLGSSTNQLFRFIYAEGEN